MTPDTESMRARAAILARLRAAPPVAAPASPDVAAGLAADGAGSGDAAVADFAACARGWRAEVIETTPTRWPAVLRDLAVARGLRSVLAGRDTELAARLPEALGARLRWYDEPLAAFKPRLFDAIDAGITTVRGGVVETGSLVLWPDVREPRTLSLVPPLHIAVLCASTLHPTLYRMMVRERWADGLPTNALLVTGPSKTADIQRLLVYGAHGPKQLVIVLVRDDRDGTGVPA
ncbi:LutC/YkgG family protein [Solimonas terrae]|uniref:LUD domain-containing protein n=1 Tax=Solimonas terrae TaxID=1396819 RepID=A0A6M2BQ96_9GAMM|nr:LUD domain-containing protein [Solimonas terrae]NGY04259.1 LUD domain-containing protein [Solimonas terrae]